MFLFYLPAIALTAFIIFYTAPFVKSQILAISHTEENIARSRSGREMRITNLFPIYLRGTWIFNVIVILGLSLPSSYMLLFGNPPEQCPKTTTVASLESTRFVTPHLMRGPW